MTCYGSYIDTFYNYCWPSLLSEGNLPALRKERDVAIVIHTDEAGMDKFEGVGKTFLGNMQGDKYDLLGRHQHQDLKTAKEHGADYSCLMPDNIYSENCFANILKLVDCGHQAIVRLLPSTTMEDMSPLLDKYRNRNVLSVPGVDLATLALANLHRGVNCWRATGGNYPQIHVIVWEGKDVVHQHSPHVTPMYIANEVIHADESELPIDSNIDKVIIGDIYCPKSGDDAVIIEISPRNNREPDTTRVDLNEFCRIFNFNTRNSKRQLQVFVDGTIDPINREMLGDHYWNDVEISEQKAIIVRALGG